MFFLFKFESLHSGLAQAANLKNNKSHDDVEKKKESSHQLKAAALTKDGLERAHAMTQPLKGPPGSLSRLTGRSTCSAEAV